jgi:endonuclease/exonuclease/phosphatase family metal-dependent hydrolase
MGPGLIRVYNAHLENRPQDTQGPLLQMGAVLKDLEAWRSEHPDTAVLLLGNFNTKGRGWDSWRREA